MSVEFAILMVDAEQYRPLVERLHAQEEQEADEDALDALRDEKDNCASPVDIYEGELHDHVAQDVSIIVERLEDHTEPGLTAFVDFAHIIYWSQTDGGQMNDLDLPTEQLELSLDEKGLKHLVEVLEAIDMGKLEAFCRDEGLDLKGIDGVFDERGLAGLCTDWHDIATQCLEQDQGLVIEVYG